MASIILGQGMAVLGSNLAGPVGGFIGFGLGKAYGKFLDNKLLYGKESKVIDGARLADLNIQTSAYGKVIPIIYGKIRIAGNIIWSLPIKEVKTSSSSTRGKYSNIEVINNGYSYFVTLAIAIGEGEIDYISRAWADTKLLDLSLERYRFYKGSEDQLPDSLIEASMGIGKTPAYRGISYIVIEDFPIAEFGNHIPNFTFEVNRIIKNNNQHDVTIKNLCNSVVIGPGYGEYVYDTEIINKIHTSIYGKKHMSANPKTPINMNNGKNLPDIIYSMEQLKSSLDEVKWLAPEINWFYDTGKIIPYVEYKNASNDQAWQVANYTRDNAKTLPVSLQEIGIGGTTNDASIIKFLKYAKLQNYKILFRANYIGDKELPLNLDSYNEFIIHYAKLVKENIDAFLIGINLKNLNDYLIENLIKLAGEVRKILGSQVKLSYASSAQNYNDVILNKLWNDKNIDFIAIEDFPADNYDLTFHNLPKPIWFTAFGSSKVKDLSEAFKKWKNSNIIENIFLYYWDARPFPYSGIMKEIWKDDGAINGKLEINNVSDIISNLLVKINLNKNLYQINIPTILEGFAITSSHNIREIIETLKQAYNFNIVEKDGKIHFEFDDLNNKIIIKESELVKINDKEAFEIIKIEDNELANIVEVTYLDKNKNYQINIQSSVNYYANCDKKISINLPFMLDDSKAKNIAENILSNIWQERFLYSFILPTKYLYLKVSDIVQINLMSKNFLIKIDKISLEEGKKIKVYGHSLTNFDKFDDYQPSLKLCVYEPVSKSIIKILQIPNLHYDKHLNKIYIAATGTSRNWPGALVNIEKQIYKITNSNIGFVQNILGKASSFIMDLSNILIISSNLLKLKNINDDQFQEFANLALVGKEIIQFKNAEIIGDNKFKLSNLQRGLFNTEKYIDQHENGEIFILLNENLACHQLDELKMSQKIQYNFLSIGENIEDMIHDQFAYEALEQKPYSPVHGQYLKLENDHTKLKWFYRSSSNEVNINFNIEIYDQQKLIKTYETSNNSILVDKQNFTAKIFQINERGLRSDALVIECL